MKILVIEDLPELCEVIVEALQEEGHAVDSSLDGEEGLYKAREWDYDLIILDIMLPQLDGWQVLEELRKEKVTPILMLTALSQTTDKVRGLNGGADDYLAKPFDLNELLARSRALLRRTSPERSPDLSVGKVIFHTADRSVSLDGRPIDLTAREYAFAELLARHRGEVLSRDYLHEHLSDENDDTLSNVLDVFVYKLRSKLGKDFITTRRGQGYLIES